MIGARRLCAVSTALALSLAVPADARKFQMSGTWISRDGGNFLPLQFAATAMGTMATGMHRTYVSMGNLTGAYAFPNGPIPGAGGATATGSAPATLRIPAHRFVEDAMFGIGDLGINAIQITTSFGVDAPYAAATLVPGGGPGSFTWCPGDTACVADGGMLSTDPPQGAGRNGRVIYRAGANRFGGAMQLGLRRGGSVSRIHSVIYDPFSRPRWSHVPFWGSGSKLRRWEPGGPGSADAPSTEKVYLKRALVTQPTMVPKNGQLILYPGPKVTTQGGVTSTGTGNVLYVPQTPIAIGPSGTQAGRFTTQYGFAHTTGTVFVQQTMGTSGDDFFTAMGSDARTPLGAGNLSLVAGGLGFRNTVTDPTGTPYATFAKVTLTLAPPIPSLSPAGVVAAAALLVLGVGYALRRRIG